MRGARVCGRLGDWRVRLEAASACRRRPRPIGRDRHLDRCRRLRLCDRLLVCASFRHLDVGSGRLRDVVSPFLGIEGGIGDGGERRVVGSPFRCSEGGVVERVLPDPVSLTIPFAGDISCRARGYLATREFGACEVSALDLASSSFFSGAVVSS